MITRDFFMMLLVISIASICTSCQPPNKDEVLSQEQAVAIMETLIQGDFDHIWGGTDTSAISKFQTDDFYILEQGEVWDNERIKAYMLKQKARTDRPKRVNKMEYISIEAHGDVIIAAYDNYASFFMADSLVANAHWLESAVAVPTDDGWRLRSMHSTRVID